jgi:ElaB/YqjD/DUF883 family membrane-anchored ribosome-binding protein
MADKQNIENLGANLERFKNLDWNKLRRNEIGVEGLGDLVESPKQQAIDIVGKAIRFGDFLDDETIGTLDTQLTRLLQLCTEQLNRNNNEYMTQKGQFLANFQGQLNKMYVQRTKIVAAGILQLGFLEPDAFRKGLSEEFGRLGAELGSRAQEEIEKIKDRANKILDETRHLAKEIELRARDTAAGFSMKDAQDQFAEASELLRKKVKFWGVVSTLLAVAAVALVLFMFAEDHDTTNTLNLIYHGALRLIMLGGFATALTFSLKMMRAYMHMREYNSHRQRIANSVGSFVQSASTPEQRDHILSKLVDAIVTFGNSGMLTSSDDVTVPSKTIIESISRTIPSGQK